MELKLEILSMNRALLGFSYNKGSCYIEKENETREVTFHEFGIGLLLINFHITFIEKEEN